MVDFIKYNEMIGGKTDLQSKERNVSVTSMELPLNFSSLKFDHEKKEIVKKTESDNSFINEKSKLRKILYVEDDKYARILMDKYLSKLYLLDLAEDSEQALKKIYTSIYDIILMDINLGKGMNGLELTQLIRRIPAYKSIPVIAVSAAIYPGNEKWVLSQGMSHYLPKPFVYKDIHTLLEKILETI
jgi:CheY-like chemotaxis protein